MVRRFIAHAFLVSLMCGASLGGPDAVLSILAQRTLGRDAANAAEVHAGGFPAQKAGNDPAVAAADVAFEQATAKDRAALAMQTDPALTWIDPAGMLQSRDEVLDSVAAGNAPQLVTLANATSAEVTTCAYERLSLVQVHAGRRATPCSC